MQVLAQRWFQPSEMNEINVHTNEINPVTFRSDVFPLTPLFIQAMFHQCTVLGT